MMHHNTPRYNSPVGCLATDVGIFSRCLAMPSRRSLLPREISKDLKWFAWNQIWHSVNSRLASCTDPGQSADLREKRQKQGEQDLKRALEHYAKAEAVNALEDATLEQFKRQVDAIASASSQGALEGRWLGTAKSEVLPGPEELEPRLWLEIVKGLKSAAIAVILLSHQEVQKAVAVQLDFDDAWSMHSERPDSAV